MVLPFKWLLNNASRVGWGGPHACVGHMLVDHVSRSLVLLVAKVLVVKMWLGMVKVVI